MSQHTRRDGFNTGFCVGPDVVGIDAARNFQPDASSGAGDALADLSGTHVVQEDCVGSRGDRLLEFGQA